MKKQLKIRKRLEKFLVFLKNKDFLIAYLITAILSISYLIGVLLRHFRLESFGYDLGIFSQEIYLLSAFKIPFSTIKIPNMVIWGDHWTVSMAIFSPLVWIFKDSALILLVSQVIFLFFGALLVWRIAKEKTADFLFSLILLFVFLIFYGIQNAVFFDAHPFFFASIGLLLLYVFYLKEKWGWFFLTAFFLANFKENISLYLIAFGFYLLLKKKYKMGLIMIGFYAGWFFLVVKYLIPFFSPLKVFSYSPQLPQNLLEIGKRFIFPPQKIKVVLTSFGNYSFLPIFSPFSLLLSLVNFGENFLGEGSLAGRWGFDRHYKAVLGPVLAIGAIEGYLFLKKRIKSKKVFDFLRILILGNMFASALVIQYFFHLQLNMLFKKEYWQRDSRKQEVLTKIKELKGKKGSILTQNNLIPHLSNRESVYLLSFKSENECKFNEGDFDYILVDVFPSQSVVNFLGCTPEEVKRWIDKVIREGKYQTLFKENEIYLLKRI